MTTAVPPLGRRRRTAAHRRAATVGPGAKCQPAPMPTGPSHWRRLPPFPQRTRTLPRAVEIALGQCQRLADAQAGAPEHDHERSRPQAVGCVAGDAHDGHDLLDGGRIGRITQTLITRRSAAVAARHGRRGPTTAGSVEQDRIGHTGTVPRQRPRRYPSSAIARRPKPKRPRHARSGRESAASVSRRISRSELVDATVAAVRRSK
jgi:hypothetical protein